MFNFRVPESASEVVVGSNCVRARSVREDRGVVVPDGSVLVVKLPSERWPVLGELQADVSYNTSVSCGTKTKEGQLT